MLPPLPPPAEPPDVGTQATEHGYEQRVAIKSLDIAYHMLDTVEVLDCKASKK